MHYQWKTKENGIICFNEEVMVIKLSFKNNGFPLQSTFLGIKALLIICFQKVGYETSSS